MKNSIIKAFSNCRNCLLILVVLITGAIVSDLLYRSDLKQRIKASETSRKLHRIESEGLNILSNLVAKGDPTREELNEYKSRSESPGLSIAIYKNDTLELWSGNDFDLPERYSSQLFENPFMFLQNRWLVNGSIQKENNIYIYLVDVYPVYNIENDYINSGFADNLGLPDGAFFSHSEDEGYPICNLKDEYLFSLQFDIQTGFNTRFVLIPVLLWLVLLVTVLYLLNRVVMNLTGRRGGYLGVLAVILFSAILYLLFLFTGKPDVINSLSFFSPYRYTAGRLIPSPGHMLLISGLLVNIAYSFFKWWPVRIGDSALSARGIIIQSLYVLPAAVIFYIYNILLSSIISSSNISFEFHRILDIDHFTIFSFLAAALLLVGLVIYLTRIYIAYSGMGLRSLLLSSGLSLVIVLILFISAGKDPLLEIVTFLLIVILTWIFRNRRSIIVISTVALSVVMGIYTAWLVSIENWNSKSEKIEALAINYGGNNDPVAEALLIESWDIMKSDSHLISMMNIDYFIEKDVTDIYDYLDSIYFTGFWDQYDIIYTVCNYDSPLQLSSTEEINCFEFFQSRVVEFGKPVIDSSLYLLDNSSGRPYYLASLFFKPESGGATGLFLELINRIDYALPGYPELLQNKKYLTETQALEYSFAKYIGDSLVMQAGAYPFDQELNHDTLKTDGFSSFTETGYECLVYHHSTNVSVVFARPTIKFLDVLVTFTYIFIIFFILFTLALLLIRPPERITLARFDFRQKLQFAFILLLLGSIIAVGIVVISLSIDQYRGKHLDNISERLSSVYIELDHKLSNEEELTSGWSQDSYADLDALLVKFSNVFFTDINLYTVEGKLLATSRREVFDMELKGDRMDFRALSELKRFGESRFIQEEKVGDLTYLSAYTPFKNYRNEVLAYLNLPYFVMQSRLSEEISNLVITIINFSLILIVISMGIAVFIAVRITNPLRMLQEGLASVTLDGEISKLEYRGHDEIAELVNQYNAMLEQLHESAIKLARSEREDAWRDMAKQIAHEIKNPLTPMKLNVQQLLKSWQDDQEKFDNRLEIFCDNMIENIENLSSIATEFSHFARMPQANPGEVDLVAQINSAAELFKNIDNLDLQINCSDFSAVIVYADKEQVNSMLTNIIRNAVQAIPSNKQGEVVVGLDVTDNKATISISDNGVGIPDKLGEKLFTPNFTTKSSGMGIGLALVKRIVETASGTIWYESKVDIGTTFFIKFPVTSTGRN